MRLKSIAIAMSSITVVCCLVSGNYDNADADLTTFYSEILAADFPGARHSIDEAIGLWPTNARYYGWRAYLTSQNLPPTCPRSLGGAQSVLKKEDQSAAHLAIDDYRRSLELNGRDAVAYHNLAWLEHLLGDDKGAAENWSTAVAIDPGNAVFHLSYGMFLEETGDQEEALGEYDKAIEITPSILDSQFFARFRMRSKAAAESLVDKLIEKLKKKVQQGFDPIVEARLGKLYLFRADLAQASTFLETASKKLPNLPLVWANLGEVYRMQGRTADALDCYRKVQVINGSLAGPYLRMGEVQLGEGHKLEATQNFTQAIQRWQRVTPTTAAHNNRLYVGPRQKIDDLLPTTLVWYTTPCEASEVWSGLSQLYPGRRDYAQRVHVCESLPSPHGD
jgi:tetratricopeptide (TPR) repeat protein